MKLTIPLAITSFAALTACVTPTATTQMPQQPAPKVATAAQETPAPAKKLSKRALSFTVRWRKNQLSGDFDPAGFSAERVQREIRSTCKGNKLVGFALGPVVAKRTTFTASCADGTVFPGGSTIIERRG